MQYSSLIVLVAAAACAASVNAAGPTQNTYSDAVARDASCGTKYQAIQDKYYTQTCKDLVFKALNTYNVADCPGGGRQGSAVGTDVWKCLSGNGNNTALINDLVNWVRGCEIFYIAARKPGGETEDGFSWIDNSCFQRFADLSSFSEYLQGDTTLGGSASSLGVKLVTVFVGIVMVLGLLL